MKDKSLHGLRLPQSKVLMEGFAALAARKAAETGVAAKEPGIEKGALLKVGKLLQSDVGASPIRPRSPFAVAFAEFVQQHRHD